MSRIPDIDARDQLPAAQRHHWDDIVASRGSVRGPFKVLLHSPELAGRAAHLGTYIRFESSLPAHVRELAALCTARIVECGYEYSAHRGQASEAGISPATLEALHNRQPSSMPEEDRWIYDFAEQLLEHHRVTPATFDTAQQHLGLQATVDLVGTIGYYA